MFAQNFTKIIHILSITLSRSQWQRSLKHELSSIALTLGSWVRIPFEAWMSICVYSVFVLGSGLATDWSLVQGSYRMSQTKKLKWNEAFRGCPVLQVGATGINQPTNQPTTNQPITLMFVFDRGGGGSRRTDTRRYLVIFWRGRNHTVMEIPWNNVIRQWSYCNSLYM
jgi:hypothetical protein